MRNEQVAIVCNRSENLGLGGRGRGREGTKQTSSPAPHPIPEFRATEEEEKQVGIEQDGGFVYDSMYAAYEEDRMNDDDWIRVLKILDSEDGSLWHSTCDPHPDRYASSTCLFQEEKKDGGETHGPTCDRAPLYGARETPGDRDPPVGGWGPVGELRPTGVLNLCAGCGGSIVDRYYLVTLNRQWHTTCLTCHHCRQTLDLHLTCFVKDGKIYCKEDYRRLFAPKRCSRCRRLLSGQELVIRAAADDVYHAACFVCVVCERHLSTGERFGVHGGRVFCQTHYGVPSAYCAAAGATAAPPRNPGEAPLASSVPVKMTDPVEEAGDLQFYRGTNGQQHKGKPRKRKAAIDDVNEAFGQKFGEAGNDRTNAQTLSDHRRQMAYSSSFAADGGCLLQKNSSRQKRMRTSFKLHQLRTMKAYFALNHNPDSKDLKQLALKTGLTKRVLQVWFQNARAKYRRNVTKQENEITSSCSGADVIGGDVTTKLSSARHVIDASSAPDFDQSECSSFSRETETYRTITEQTVQETNSCSGSTSGSTLLDMFGQVYLP